MIRVDRRKTRAVGVGGVVIGGDAPVVVQSMTNTDTADIPSTVDQVKLLADAGSEIVRVTVNNDAAAQAVPQIVEALRGDGYDTPIVGDFHYNGHILLTKFPAAAQALAKLRINPGNVGTKHRDKNFTEIVRVAIEHDKPVRIGVNWGSLDQRLLTELMDANSALTEPKDAGEVLMDAMVESAVRSATLAEETGLGSDRIVISTKVSTVRSLIHVYRLLADRCDYPLHLGLTEAGLGAKGIVATTAGLAPLLLDGIGDTIRVSLTPGPVAIGPRRCGWPNRCCSPWASAPSSRRSPRAPAAGAPPPPSSRRWRRTSPASSGRACPRGARSTPAWRRWRWP